MKQIDVRTIAPRERHPQIFESFDALRVGEAIEVVNDHDPKPLYYQFEAERQGEVAWRYLEEGPEVWRVRIARASHGAGAGESDAVTLETTINEVLERSPDLSGVLNDMGIDTCCGGSKSLGEAALGAGADPEALLALAARTPPTR